MTVAQPLPCLQPEVEVAAHRTTALQPQEIGGVLDFLLGGFGPVPRGGRVGGTVEMG
jgi:hypothetical protein